MVKYSWLLSIIIILSNIRLAHSQKEQVNKENSTSSFILKENFDTSNYKNIYHINNPKKLCVISNYKSTPNGSDSLIFDFLFSKFGTYGVSDKIKVQLYNYKSNVKTPYYNRIDSVGQYKNIHLTNFPNTKDPYAIRINLKNLKDKQELVTKDDKKYLTLKISIVKDKLETLIFERENILLLINP